MSDSFFERWSRRKQQVREGEAPPPEAPASPAPAPAPVALREEARTVTPPEAPPPPTLADADALTPESDFKPFVARNVAPEVRNAAMKKLFADPHFNVMDRMDVYIDDYSQTVPLPAAALRQMASAAFLNLVDDEAAQKKDLLETPPTESAQDVAQSEHPSPPAAQEDAQPASQETDDHHADLRLQQDDAARAEDPRHRAGS